MMLSLIHLKRKSPTTLSVQLANQIVDLIKREVLRTDLKLPGSRKIAENLGIHRKTVIAALDDLMLQGWLYTVPGKGTFVALQAEPTVQILEAHNNAVFEAESHPISPILLRKVVISTERLHLDDGLPDPRLAPLTELHRAYKTALTRGNLYRKFGYGDTKGNLKLRKVLATYLQETRGLKATEDNVLITRGVTQSLYLCIKFFIKPGDTVAVGETNWESANANFRYQGAEILKVKVDKQGLDSTHLEELLENHSIRMLYLTPHHHYPSTVILPANRRLHIIRLALKHGFYVFEDDYDFDFHYQIQPIMPLASTHHGSRVLYTGSFTKAISPVFRVGYLVASREQVDYLAGLRRLVDRQGDNLLELALAEMLELGILQRYLRKNKRIYEQRRDIFCQLLSNELSDFVRFEKPMGGMAVWTHFNSEIDLGRLTERALDHDLFMLSNQQFGVSHVTRLGFASSNVDELVESIRILKMLLQN